MAKGFECFEGQFQDAVCIPLTPCSGSASVTNGKIGCTEADYGKTCAIECDMEAGFSPYVAGAVATCDVSGEGDMSFVAPTGMTLAEVCVPTTCTPPEVSANAEWFDTTGTSVDEVWTIKCSEGFVVDIEGALDTQCQLTGERTSPDPKCIEAAGCDGSVFPSDDVDETAGTGTCEADMKDGEWCKLECNAGFAPIGDLLCNNGVLDGISRSK
jgi:hypothetical protein